MKKYLESMPLSVLPLIYSAQAYAGEWTVPDEGGTVGPIEGFVTALIGLIFGCYCIKKAIVRPAQEKNDLYTIAMRIIIFLIGFFLFDRNIGRILR